MAVALQITRRGDADNAGAYHGNTLRIHEFSRLVARGTGAKMRPDSGG